MKSKALRNSRRMLSISSVYWRMQLSVTKWLPKKFQNILGFIINILKDRILSLESELKSKDTIILLTFTCSKSTIKALGKDVKYVQN